MCAVVAALVAAVHRLRAEIHLVVVGVVAVVATRCSFLPLIYCQT
jgi:hypothetical protein